MIMLLAATRTQVVIAASPGRTGEETRIFVVAVYQQVDGQWIEKQVHAFNSKDKAKAREYVSKTESSRGWRAILREVADLEGRTASGRLGRYNGGTRFFAEFLGNGVVMLRTAEEQRSFKGRWSQDGDKITMKAGASEFTGTIRGQRIDGSRQRSNAKRLRGTNDTWFLEVEPERE
jgi:hypothetical protein